MNERAVEEARLWLGTPYLHQASTKGAGCDCLGLLRGVWRALYDDEPNVPPYSPDWDEVRREDVLFTAAHHHLEPCERRVPEPGDVLLFRMRAHAVAKHLGIATSASKFIHAYSGHGVVESTLSTPWKRRVVGIFAFPKL